MLVDVDGGAYRERKEGKLSKYRKAMFARHLEKARGMSQSDQIMKSVIGDVAFAAYQTGLEKARKRKREIEQGSEAREGRISPHPAAWDED